MLGLCQSANKNWHCSPEASPVKITAVISAGFTCVDTIIAPQIGDGGEMLADNNNNNVA